MKKSFPVVKTVLPIALITLAVCVTATFWYEHTKHTVELEKQPTMLSKVNVTEKPRVKEVMHIDKQKKPKTHKKEAEPDKHPEIRKDRKNNNKPVQKSNPRTFSFELTAYTALCPSGCTGITATGIDVTDSVYYNGMRIIAVDPSYIPLWSIVKIKLNGHWIKTIALDTGGAIDGYDADLLVGNRDKAFNIGRQHVKAKIIRKGK